MRCRGSGRCLPGFRSGGLDTAADPLRDQRRAWNGFPGRWAVAKNAANGFVTGLGGSRAAAGRRITNGSANGFARDSGANGPEPSPRSARHVPNDDHVRDRDPAQHGAGPGSPPKVAKLAGVQVVDKVALHRESVEFRLCRPAPDQTGRWDPRLLVKFGQRGVVNLVKMVPLLGGAVGAGFDGATCQLVGRAADRVFRNA